MDLVKGIAGRVLPSGQQLFDNVGGTFTVPPGVKSINVSGMGRGGDGGPSAFDDVNIIEYGGGGGGGGGFCYKNNIPVTPGQTITITINDTHSKFAGGGVDDLTANRGSDGFIISYGVGGTATAPGGWAKNGGNGSSANIEGGESGGGGAPGNYFASGASWITWYGYANPFVDSGGASSGIGNNYSGGGGMGIKVKGNTSTTDAGNGSNGTNGEKENINGGKGGDYGGGGGGGRSTDGAPTPGGLGGKGAVRITWGKDRTYPDDSADV